MEATKKKVPFYDRIEWWIIVILFSCMTVVTFFTVCSRYIFSFTFSWAEQLTRLMLVWISFAGISWAGKINVHNRVTVIAVIFSKHEKLVRTLLTIGDLLGMAFGLYMAWQTGTVMMKIMSTNQMMPSMLWCPKWVMYLPGVLGMVGMSLRILQRLYGMYFGKTKQSLNQIKEGGTVE